jgi:hypothetical protein
MISVEQIIISGGKKMKHTEGKKEQLVTRKRVNWTINRDIVDMLQKLSEETGTPISRLIDRAVSKVYGKGK